MTNGSLMKVESTGIIGIENQFLVFLRVAVLHRFYCMCKLVDKKTITILQIENSPDLWGSTAYILYVFLNGLVIEKIGLFSIWHVIAWFSAIKGIEITSKYMKFK